MKQEIIDFINEHEDLIDNNEWDKLYNLALETDGLRFASEIGALTSIFLSCNIHPEIYLEELPDLFLAFTDITNFTIPSNIYKIGARAFYGCSSLTDVIIPDSVTSIGVDAFYRCSSLVSITIPSSVTSISGGAFEWCFSLTSVTIGNGVTEIGYKSFSDCSSIESITIPDSVTYISDGAFNDCDDKLVITYAGTKENWKKIYNKDAFSHTYFTVHCIDGKITKRKRS